MRQDAKVRDLAGQDLGFRRSSEECSVRVEAQRTAGGMAKETLARFAAFLNSPGVVEQLRTVKPVPRPLQEILDADKPEEVAEALVTMPSKDRKNLAKLLKALLGKKSARVVRLSDFHPKTETLWEAQDIENMASEFREFLKGQWEKDIYLKIEP
jgi:hypothetical protein